MGRHSKHPDGTTVTSMRLSRDVKDFLKEHGSATEAFESFVRKNLMSVHPVHSKARAWVCRIDAEKRAARAADDEAAAHRAAEQSLRDSARKELGVDPYEYLAVADQDEAVRAAEAELQDLRSIWARVRGRYDQTLLKPRVNLLTWLTTATKELSLERLGLEPKSALELLKAGKEPASLSAVRVGVIEGYQEVMGK